jgi:hypothetical protein
MKKKTKKRSDWNAEGLAIPAGLFIGLGIGLINGQVAGGVLIGLGVGFLFTLLVRLVGKK